MKRKLISVVIFFILFFAYAKEHKQKIFYLDMPKQDFISLLGESKNIYVQDISQNSDWDLICYSYENIDIYCYRIINSINKIYMNSDKILLDIDNNLVKCGYSRKDIELKFGNGSFDGFDKKRNEKNYHYSLSDFRELQVFYNSDDIVIGIFYGYQNPN